jgi:hypothetical protein
VIYAPTRDDARRFLFDTWRKYRQGQPLAGLETVALQVMLAHPEYFAILDAPDRHADRDYAPEGGELNPFLHLSLHLAVEEQLSIDQPPGIRGEFERLRARKDTHAAKHDVLECLGEVVWQAQRSGRAPDAEAYLECLRRK